MSTLHKNKEGFFTTRAFQIDLARQPENIDLENGLRLNSFREAGTGLTKEEISELVDFASGYGVEIVPSLNLLGHTEGFLKNPSFKNMSETREGARQMEQNWNNCLCPSLPETRRWVASVIEEVSGLFPSPYLHLGLDETWELGSCSLCRQKEKEIGLGGLFAEYVNFLHRQTEKHSKTMLMWADMCFYYPGVIERLDKGIIMVDWHYSPIKDVPRFSFFNWQKVDSLRVLTENGFKVIAAGGSDPENVTTFSRYAKRFGVDSFLVTEWEGRNRYQDNVTINRCIAGNILFTGQVPSSEEVGKQVLSDYSTGEQKMFLLSAGATDNNLSLALNVLKGLKQGLLNRVVRSGILQKEVLTKKEKIEKGLRETIRNMLKGKSAHSEVLKLQILELKDVIKECEEWTALLNELSDYYAETKDARDIYGTADKSLKNLISLKERAENFLKNPVVENYPFAPLQIVIEILTIDPCAHSCCIKVSADGRSYETVYKVNALPIKKEGTSEVYIPVSTTPGFLRISIGGYARVGIANIRYETAVENVFPVEVIETGGSVIEPANMLEWNSKATFFNQPDVKSRWLSADIPVENYVILRF